MAVPNKIESCTEQTLELGIEQIFVVSQAKAQLPLQIEDASRAETDVSIWNCVYKSLISIYSKIRKKSVVRT